MIRFRTDDIKRDIRIDQGSIDSTYQEQLVFLMDKWVEISPEDEEIIRKIAEKYNYVKN
jgi:hypothetical protein